MHFSKKPIVLAVALALPAIWQNAIAQAVAPTGKTLDEVVISSSRIEPAPAPAGKRGGQTLAPLRDIPGVNLQGAGAVSSLPVINGMAGDRVRTKVDGMDLIASCPNHMNPPLSYLDPSSIESLKVYSGISPVSAGGDSIAGTIIAKTRDPVCRPRTGTARQGRSRCFLSQQRQFARRQPLGHAGQRKPQPELYGRHRPIRQLQGRQQLQELQQHRQRRPDAVA